MKLSYLVIFSLSCLVIGLSGASLSQEFALPFVPPKDTSKHCYSQNDPHIRDFNGNTYDFQKIGTYCMYNSGIVKVEAEFEKCYAYAADPTCNCRARVTIKGTYFVDVDTCSGGSIDEFTSEIPTTVLQTFLLPPILAHFTVGHTPAYNYIRTNIGGGHDIEVRIYPGWVKMNRIEVDASFNYLTSGQQKTDCCLCGNHYNPRTTNEKIAIDCDAVLFNGARKAVQTLLDVEGANLMDLLAQNCIDDVQAVIKLNSFCNDRYSLDHGLFQLDVVNAKIVETGIRKFGTTDLTNRGFTLFLSNVCKAQFKKLNTQVVYGKGSLATLCI